MKTELEEKDIELIAQRVMELIKPLLNHGNGNGNEDDILTIEEASKFLKTSKGQIYQWVNNSKHGLKPFPYFKTGKRLRFSKNSLLKWMMQEDTKRN